MRDGELVVADTSPLLNLSLIDRLDLLESQFPTVVVPDQVWDELEAGETGLAPLRDLRSSGFLSTVTVERDDLYREIARDLDVGETAAIVHAITAGADLILLDERDARRVARRHDLAVTGVIGVLLRGAAEGTVDLRSELDALRDEGFWLSDELVDEILERSGDVVGEPDGNDE